MLFELRQSFSLESARFLPKLPMEHPCRSVHGHSFYVTLVIRAPFQEHTGWTIDYHWIESQWEKNVKSQLDHRLLNEIPGLENPTSENLCLFLYHNIKQWLPTLHQVIVKETPHTECRYPV